MFRWLPTALFGLAALLGPSGRASAQAPAPAAPLPPPPVPASVQSAPLPDANPPAPEANTPAADPVARRQARLMGDNRGYGFRNPGGVGRMAQYYPPGDRFQNAGRGAPRIPSYGEYPPALSRAAQFEAQRVGAYRSDVLYRHIDAYGSPRFVVGIFPFWGGGGFWP